MSTDPCVAVLQRSLRRYREPFYRALRAELGDRGIGLRFIHNTTSEREHRGDPGSIPWAEVKRCRYLTVRGNELVWQPCLRLSREVDLVIVEQAAALLANYLLVAGQRLGGARVGFWGHGRNFNTNATSSSGEAVKRLVSRQAHWWFPYTDEGAAIVARTGFPSDRITVVHNATDTRQLAAHADAVSDGEVRALREELRLTGDNVGVFVGSFSPVKQLDYLIAAADRVRAAVPDFELVTAGGGVLGDRLATAGRDRPWLRITHHRFERELAVLLKAAKLLLIPGGVGLVAVDSFAAGTPLVASGSLPHGPEIGYVRDGVNGRIVDDGGDPARYGDAVAALLADDERRAALRRGGLKERSEYSVEDMAARFATGIERALAYPG